MHEESVTDDLDASVMPSSHCVEAEQVGTFAETLELQVTIAFDARIRGEPLTVGLRVWIDHMGTEVVGEVENEMIDPELLSDATSVVDVGDRAAPRVAVAAPKPHRDTDDVVPGVDQLRRCHR